LIAGEGGIAATLRVLDDMRELVLARAGHEACDVTPEPARDSPRSFGPIADRHTLRRYAGPRQRRRSCAGRQDGGEAAKLTSGFGGGVRGHDL
jgi:hypothetical protein